MRPREELEPLLPTATEVALGVVVLAVLLALLAGLVVVARRSRRRADGQARGVVDREADGEAGRSA